MKLRQLEEALQEVRPFEDPDVWLEQYPTSAHIAARILFTAHSSFDDVEGRVVADFGCGTGMFGIGAAILGANAVVGYDIDPKALAIARENASRYDLSLDLVHADMNHLPLRGERIDRPSDRTRQAASMMMSDLCAICLRCRALD